MRRTRGIFSWVVTSVLTVVSAVGIVAMTTGNLASTATSTATAAATTAATTALATAAPVGVVTYHDGASESGN